MLITNEFVHAFFGYNNTFRFPIASHTRSSWLLSLECNKYLITIIAYEKKNVNYLIKLNVFITLYEYFTHNKEFMNQHTIFVLTSWGLVAYKDD